MTAFRLGTTTVATTLLVLTACGSEQPPIEQPTGDGGALGRFQPRIVGAAWTYHEVDTETGFSADRTTTVEAFEDVGPSHPGKQAFRVRVDKLYDSTVFWEGYEGDVTLRYRNDDYGPSGALVGKQFNTPGRLKLDETAEHLRTGAVYTRTWSETSTDPTGTSSTETKAEQWTVISAHERVTVPYGTFEDALHVRRLNTESASQKTKDYWYVRGIGKVKETGGGQTEELMSFVMPSPSL